MSINMRPVRWLAIGLWLVGPRSASADVVISEFMASNRSTLQDQDGEFNDWLEIANRGETEVNLDGWFATDSAENLTQWRFPAIRLGPGQHRVIFASEKNRRPVSGQLHTNFRLEKNGEYLALVEPDGRTIAFQFRPEYPEQFPDISYGLSGTPGDPGRFYFTAPTPGSANGAGLPGVAPAPEFSQPSGAFDGSFSLILGADSPGAVVRYTTSTGAVWLEPNETSTQYSGPISVTQTMVIKARSFEPGLLPSRTVTRTYIRTDSATRSFSSNLPIVVINTFGRGIGTSSFTPAHVHVVAPGTDGRTRLTEAPDFSGIGGLKVRGSSTAGREKASYNFEVWDEDREDRDVSILGLPEESDWILYGPYNFDRALIRNAFIYELSNQIGQYAVRSRFVEVYRNLATGTLTGSHYFGVYVFMEKIKRDPDRVNVERLTPGDNSQPEVAGGYMLKIDRLDPGDSGLSAGGRTLGLVYPKEREITSFQRNYIRNYIDSFVNVLNSANFTHPELGYAAYIDTDAWIEHHILNVLAMNVDALRLSTYMFKPRFGKLAMGPIWDFDRSMESYDGRDDNPRAWNGTGDGTRYFDYPWWSRLFQDPDFWQAWRDRWHELRQGTFSVENISAVIDGMATELSEAQVRNFQRWNLGLRSGGWPAEIEHMKDWLVTRMEWIDDQFPGVPVFSQGSSVISPGFELFMSAASGTLYYTLDGTDPRLPGGAISPTAIEYGSSGSATLLSPAEQTVVQVLVPTSGTLGTSWTLRDFVPGPQWTTGTTGIGVGYERGSGYESLIDVNVEGEMYNGNTSVYIRVEFDVDDPTSFAFLDLGMKYDDGFVAYLNGTRVASSNAPASPSWNSNATGQNGDGSAVSFESFNITQHIDQLVAGTNVLAIHGLNVNPTSSDLLFVPQLLASGTFSGDGAVVLDDFTRVRARTRLGNDWSAPALATYALDPATDLRVTELMYHPPDPGPGSAFSDEDFEFLEIQNIGASFVDLRGVRLTSGVEFDFTEGAVTSLAPGDLLVVVRNLEAFETVYGVEGMLLAGQYTGNLENQGENIRLENGAGDVILEFRYEDFWYPDTDGQGYSLVVADVGAPTGAWNEKPTWQPSDLLLGTPGEGETFSGGRQLPGDADQSSRVDIGDALALLFQIFRGAQHAPPCDGADINDGGNVPLLDYNGDSVVDISDSIHLLTYLFLRGDPHVLGTRCVRIEGCPSACLR